jgi:hypothetical protein
MHQGIAMVREYAGRRTEERGVVGLTGIINRRRRPWLKFELKFEQPGGRAWVVLEVKNDAGDRGLYRRKEGKR